MYKRQVLADESEEKERYTSTMCFKTEEELAKYKTKGSDDIITPVSYTHLDVYKRQLQRY